jgi:hypothetical protein
VKLTAACHRRASVIISVHQREAARGWSIAVEDAPAFIWTCIMGVVAAWLRPPPNQISTMNHRRYRWASVGQGWPPMRTSLLQLLLRRQRCATSLSVLPVCACAGVPDGPATPDKASCAVCRPGPCQYCQTRRQLQVWSVMHLLQLRPPTLCKRLYYVWGKILPVRTVCGQRICSTLRPPLCLSHDTSISSDTHIGEPSCAPT